jgi:hypothetical protein
MFDVLMKGRGIDDCVPRRLDNLLEERMGTKKGYML